MKPKVIVVPDVHGRTFWKDILPHVGKSRIIFLGDYLDPYYDDAIVFNMTQESVIQNFEEIIVFKRTHADSVTLLLGNHDCEYMYGRSVCDDRCDKWNYERIQTLFRENKDCFQIATECFIAGKPYIFSHAGLHIKWLDDHVSEWTPESMVNLVNKLNEEALACSDPEHTGFARALAKEINIVLVRIKSVVRYGQMRNLLWRNICWPMLFRSSDIAGPLVCNLELPALSCF